MATAANDDEASLSLSLLSLSHCFSPSCASARAGGVIGLLTLVLLGLLVVAPELGEQVLDLLHLCGAGEEKRVCVGAGKGKKRGVFSETVSDRVVCCSVVVCLDTRQERASILGVHVCMNGDGGARPAHSVVLRERERSGPAWRRGGRDCAVGRGRRGGSGTPRPLSPHFSLVFSSVCLQRRREKIHHLRRNKPRRNQISASLSLFSFTSWAPQTRRRRPAAAAAARGTRRGRGAGRSGCTVGYFGGLLYGR